MTLKTSVLAVMLAAALTQACPPDPKPPGPDGGDAAPPPSPDASPPNDAGAADAAPPSDYDLACLALKQSGCNEGQKTDCALAMRKNQEGHINDYRPKCLAACATKACVHACGKAVSCP